MSSRTDLRFVAQEFRQQRLAYIGGWHPQSQWHERLRALLCVPSIAPKERSQKYGEERSAREEAMFLVYAVTPRQGELHTLNQIQIQLMEDYGRPRAPKRPLVLILLDEDDGVTWSGKPPLVNTSDQFKYWPAHRVFTTIESAAAFLNAQLADNTEEAEWPSRDSRVSNLIDAMASLAVTTNAGRTDTHAKTHSPVGNSPRRKQRRQRTESMQ